MSEISNLGYAVLGVSDIAKWADFATLLGFKVGEGHDGVSALRLDNYAQRLALEPGDEDDLRAVGWEFDTVEELDVYVASLRRRGVEIEQGGPELAARRQVERLFVTKDPSSVAHEFYVCARIATEPFSSPALKGPGFVTGALGFGHLLLRADDLPRSIAYCSEILGLRLSDRILEEVAPGIVVDATFFHTKTGRHHSMAVAVMPGTRRIGHLMVEVQSMDDVGLAFERCVAAGHPIRATLGKHPNDQMFSFYVETPSGFSLEYGWGGIVIDQPDWDARTYDRLSVWGHKRQAPLGQRTA